MNEITLLPDLASLVSNLSPLALSDERKNVLEELVGYIQSKRDENKPINLNFICTHNSRRSQLSQVWAKVAADYHGIPIGSFSGGVEVTAFNQRAVASLKRFGFEISEEGGENPDYQVSYSRGAKPLQAFSKVFDDPANPTENFAAIMTCAHADENCPYIAGAEVRIPIRYKDPKAFDDTPEESARYDERSRQIASEMWYVFSRIH